ncbi:unnamed protein product [Protopolystoma xenopodis]|uniref:Uncharacterized protein n=1 Tax=Protopolystoma xenopodis TaxID=117903 RepID=A0A448X427_9PLAT|nr:unnamed protein product [Protopolystoma xenopodis]
MSQKFSDSYKTELLLAFYLYLIQFSSENTRQMLGLQSGSAITCGASYISGILDYLLFISRSSSVSADII